MLKTESGRLVLSCIKNGILHVKVKTGKHQTMAREAHDGIVIMDVHAQPVDGKANRELATYLSRLLKKRIILSSGHSAKTKTFRIID